MIEEIRKLDVSDIPIFAICLDISRWRLRTVSDTHKIEYGHRGGNHPRVIYRRRALRVSFPEPRICRDTDNLIRPSYVLAFENVNDGNRRRLSYTRKEHL